MATRKNRQLVLRERPTGVVEDQHFEVVESTMPAPAEGQVVVRTMWLSFDPAQRGWLNDIRSYVPPVAIGEVMRARGIGEVVASRAPDLPEGTLVAGPLGWQEYAVVD